jgi:hypothetical protein
LHSGLRVAASMAGTRRRTCRPGPSRGPQRGSRRRATPPSSPLSPARPRPLFPPLPTAGAQQRGYAYVPFRDRYENDSAVVAVDCSHPRLPTLSHQRGSRNPDGLKPADTSTGLVLNALKTGPWKRDVWSLCQRRRGPGAGAVAAGEEREAVRRGRCAS